MNSGSNQYNNNFEDNKNISYKSYKLFNLKRAFPFFDIFNNNRVANYKLKLLFTMLVVLLFLSIIGFSYSIIRYALDNLNNKQGNKVDMIYSYVESNDAGNGIAINNAFPISDFEGKNLTGSNYTFNFTVTFYPKSLNGNYKIVAVKSDDSSLSDEVIKLYLTNRETSNGTEEEIKNSINREGMVKTYQEYDDFNIDSVEGKVLYSEKVSEKLINKHSKYFTLRMWIDDKTNFDVNTSNKTFKVKINFYGS